MSISHSRLSGFLAKVRLCHCEELKFEKYHIDQANLLTMNQYKPCWFIICHELYTLPALQVNMVVDIER